MGTSKNPAAAVAALPLAGGQGKLETGCFACGRDNPHGLQLRFAIDDAGNAVASWLPLGTWTGFQNVIHGGLLTTAMDEAMAKAIVARGVEGLTCELRVRFRASVQPGAPVHIRGWIVTMHHRLIRAEASISAPGGQEHAHAWASFLVLPGVLPRHAS